MNAALFELMESALDALIDAAHAREGVIEYVADDAVHLEAFVDWATEELNPAIDAVRALYFKCTTEPLEKARAR